MILRGDTTWLIRIRDGDTSFVGVGFRAGAAEGELGVGEPADGGAAAGLVVAVAVPEAWEPDSTRTAQAAEATGGQPADPDTLPVRDGPPATDAAAFAARQIEVMMDTGVVAGPDASAWGSARPGDRLELSVGRAAAPGRWYEVLAERWCGRASRRVRTTDGRIVLRRALFYPPPMPEPPRLPPITEQPDRALEECRLGNMWVEIPVEQAAADSVAERLRAALGERFGEPSPLAPPASVSRYQWDEYTTWRAGHVTIATANEGGYGTSHVVGAAWSPAAGLELPLPYSWDGSVETEMDGERLARLVGLEPARARGLLRLAEERRTTGQSAAERAAADSLFLDRIEAWLVEGRKREPQARAAALLIADRALSTARITSEFARRDSAQIRRRIGDLGATLEKIWGEGYHYGYAGDLLLEAYDLARGTPMGDRAFIRLLRTGFDPSPNCPEVDAFRRIVEEGEAFLEGSASRAVDRGILAETHRLVAEAYADVVAIDAGLAPEAWVTAAPVDTAVAPDVVPTPRNARRSAVEHYQAALDLMPASPDKESVWREAWRLAMGLSPHATRFVCAWD